MPVLDPVEEDDETGPLGRPPLDAEAVTRAVEAAPLVRRRHQFFVWSQGPLQPLVPHEILVCGAYARALRRLTFDLFNSVVLPPHTQHALTDPAAPFLRSLAAAWLAARCQPLRVDLSRLAEHERVVGELAAAGIGTLAVHGVSRPQRVSELETFFVFAGRSGRLPLSNLEMLMPHLHSVWLRVVAAQAEAPPSAPAPPRVAAPRPGLTARECEVLAGVRDGRSNQDIAVQLGLSPLTVKNHVQKILRKLDAANRAQAVAQAMSLGLLDERRLPR